MEDEQVLNKMTDLPPASSEFTQSSGEAAKIEEEKEDLARAQQIVDKKQNKTKTKIKKNNGGVLTKKIKDLENSVEKIASTMDKLGDLIVNMAETKQAEGKVNSEQEAKEIVVDLPPENVTSMIPTKWREKVVKFLGSDFKIEVAESSGGNYLLSIIVPERFDRRIGDERNMSPYDHSTSLIRRSNDLTDVENLCIRMAQTIKKQYDNFESPALNMTVQTIQ